MSLPVQPRVERTSATQTERKTLMQELYDAYIGCPSAWASVQAIARTITAGRVVTEWTGDDEKGDQTSPRSPTTSRPAKHCAPSSTRSPSPGSRPRRLGPPAARPPGTRVPRP
jgi:hypothetical protein